MSTEPPPEPQQERPRASSYSEADYTRKPQTEADPLRLVYPYTPERAFINNKRSLPQQQQQNLDSDFGLDGAGDSHFEGILRKGGVLDLQYIEPATNQEFVRFCHRGLEGAVMIFFFCFGLLFYAMVPAQRFLFYGAAALYPALGLDVGLHTLMRGGARFTAQVAQVRHFSHVLAAVGFLHATSWHVQGSLLGCLETEQWVYRLLHGGNHPSLFLEHISCGRTINAYTVFSITISMCALRMDLRIHWLMTLLHFGLQLLGFWFDPASDFAQVQYQETGGSREPLRRHTVSERWIISIVAFCAMTISNLVAFAKHRTLQRQFEGAMEAYLAMESLKQRQRTVDSLLSSMVPASALESLVKGERVLDTSPGASVLFSDMVEFTRWSSQRSPEQVVSMLSVLVRRLDTIAATLGVEKVKTIGDCYWAVTGIPDQNPRHADLMIEFGLSLVKMVRGEAQTHVTDWAYPPAPGAHQTKQLVGFRVGIDSGPLLGGVIGSQQLSYEVFGETSSIANLVEQHGVAMKVVVSERTKGLSSDIHGFTRLPRTLPLTRKPENHRSLDCLQGSSSIAFVATPEPGDREAARQADPLNMQDEEMYEESAGDCSVSSPAAAEANPTSDEPYAMALYEIQVVKNERGDNADSIKSDSIKSVSQGLGATRQQRADFLQMQMARREANYEVADAVEVEVHEDTPKRGEGEDMAEDDSGKQGAMKEFAAQRDVEDLLAHFGKRKYKWLRLDFAKDDIEGEFRLFVRKEMKGAQRWGIMMAIVMVFIIFILFTADARHQISALCLFFWWLSLAGFTVALGVMLSLSESEKTATEEEQDEPRGCDYFSSTLRWKTEAVSLVCPLVGCGSLVGATLAAPDSMLTNDALYLLPIFLLLITLPQAHVSSIYHYTLALVFFMLPACYTAFFLHPMATDNIKFSGVAFVTALVLAVVLEKRIRMQFLETKIATHYGTQQLVAVKAQEAVLATMVPDFVITALSAWLTSDFDPKLAVAQRYEQVSVAFIRLASPPAEYVSPTSSPLLLRSTSPIKRVHSGPDLAGPDEGEDEIVPASPPPGVATWLFDSHAIVDDVLTGRGPTTFGRARQKAAAPLVDKVKTVGDLVIVAGSFRGHSAERGAAAMLSLVVRLQTRFDLEGWCKPTVGLHAGAVMGIVLGRSRLAFDIFGDAVNTSSRVMSGPDAKHKTTASTDYLALLPAAPFTLRDESTTNAVARPGSRTAAWAGETVTFGPDCQLKAKGKGTLCVKEIVCSVAS